MLTERYLKHAFTIRLGSCSVHRPNQALPKRENIQNQNISTTIGKQNVHLIFGAAEYVNLRKR